MTLTTYILLAIEHEGTESPHLWEWDSKFDARGTIKLLSHGQASVDDIDALTEAVRTAWMASWLKICLTADYCPRCQSPVDSPDPTCSLCFRRSRADDA
jgi:hypothetical protein